MSVIPAAVFWDMDGTLVDSEGEWMVAAAELLEQFGGTLDHEVRHALVGASMDTAAAVLRSAGVDLASEEIISVLMSRVSELVRHGAVWRPGARELCAEIAAAHIPQALVTMSYRTMAEDVLEQLDSNPFAVVIAGDFGGEGKPSPDPYLAAAAALGVDPRDCVAFEDSPTGVASAVASGAATIAVPLYLPVSAEGIADEWTAFDTRGLADVVAVYSGFTRTLAPHTNRNNEREQQ